MAWSVQDVATKNNILTQINTALGAAAKISWQNASNTELAVTSLYAAAAPFAAPASGQMLLLSAAGSSTTPLGLLSGTFSASGTTQAKFQTNGSLTILSGVVASPTGGDINCDAIPTSGQQLRLDSLTLQAA